MAIKLLAGAVLLVQAPAALAFPDGAPPGHTGGFGEPTCGACHYVFEGAPTGALRLEGIADAFEPGRTYALELRLVAPGQAVGGFQIGARYAEGGARGRAAGRLEGEGNGMGVVTLDEVPYVGHRRTKPLDGGGSARWRLRWTAPEAPAGPVAFHAAAVAGDDDSSPLGDHVYDLKRYLSPR